MTATRATLPVLPRCRRPRWKCWWMPSCRITDRAAMYSAWRTAAPDRPLASLVATVPRLRRKPHQRSQGLAVPLTQFGKKDHSMAAVKGAQLWHTAVQRGLWAEGSTALPQGLAGRVFPQPARLAIDPWSVPAQPLWQLLTFRFGFRRTGVQRQEH